MSGAGEGEGERPKLRLLIDTNVFIALEPYAGRLESGIGPAGRLMRLVNEQGHRIFVHPATEDDLREGTDPTRLRQRLAELKKFSCLSEGPIPADLKAAAGDSPPGTNDHRDLRLLAALRNRAVTQLISDDRPLRRRAARAGLGESALSLIEAVELLEGFAPAVAPPPPRVDRLEPYALDSEQDIFSSLRKDYEGFDDWLDEKVRGDPDNRDCLVVRDGQRYAALAIVKRVERDCAYDFPQPVTKIATLKVGQDYGRSKYGELLLKSIFADARHRGSASLYVEILPKHQALIDLLAEFGFADSGHRTTRGEVVVAKRRQPPAEAAAIGPLEHHTRYGPPAILGTGSVFVVPILPQWHEQLFPDAPGTPPVSDQPALPGLEPPALTHPWGNALRKAYLSNSKITKIAPGDTLLFYRSKDAQTVSAVGVVESTLRSADPVQVMSFVGRRTVYTPSEITQMCSRVGGVLAILFRQDRFIDPPWSRAELQHQGVFATWPQSIAQVAEGGAEWVQEQLVE